MEPNLRIKKNVRGFVLLFAMTIASILLAIAIGVANVAVKEISFSSSARASNDAFVAADTGAECALFYDKLTSASAFPVDGPASHISCNSTSILPSYSPSGQTGSYYFVVSGMGSLGVSCAKILILKDKSFTPTKVTIVSTGYDVGNSVCASNNLNRVERELRLSY